MSLPCPHNHHTSIMPILQSRKQRPAELMGLAKVHTIGRWPGQDMNPDPSVSKAKTLRREGSKSRSSGARKLVGESSEGDPKEPVP